MRRLSWPVSLAAAIIAGVLVGIGFHILLRGEAEEPRIEPTIERAELPEHAVVPTYRAHYIRKEEDTFGGSGYEPRCPSDLPDCYVVSTDADDQQSLALIVKDIVREEKIWGTHEDEVLYFEFEDTAGANTTGSAYAFRNEAIREEWMREHLEMMEMQQVQPSGTVIGGVYVIA